MVTTLDNTTELKAHPIAALFPLLKGQALENLAAGIKRDGQQRPITLWKDQIIDGRNRYAACKMVGVGPWCEEWNGQESELRDKILALNVDQRHMNESQRAIVAARLSMGSAHGRPRKKGAMLPLLPMKLEEAAKRLNVCERTIKKARVLVEGPDADAGLVQDIEDGEQTVTGALNVIKDRKKAAKRAANADKVAESDDPSSLVGIYSTIVIDPPWDYSEEGNNDAFGRVKPKYAQMSLEDIAALPVGDLGAEESHLWLWITNRRLISGEGEDLMRSWNYEPIAPLTWCKPSIGVGNYLRHNTEHALLGVRGSMKRKEGGANIGTWFAADRGPKGHSSKPTEFFAIVERHSPGPYLEMFARSEREGWTAWGGEVS